MDTKQIVLKQDRLGRVQRTVEQRAVVVEEFKRSGLSLGRFAQLSGIGYSTLWTWLKEAGLAWDNLTPRIVSDGFITTTSPNALWSQTTASHCQRGRLVKIAAVVDSACLTGR